MAIARLYAELWAELDKKGDRISAHDLLIGATALSRNYSVATFNQRDFKKLPGLQLEVIQ